MKKINCQEIKVGDVVVSVTGKRFEVVKTQDGLRPPCPYLFLRGDDGKDYEHDTSWTPELNVENK